MFTDETLTAIYRKLKGPPLALIAMLLIFGLIIAAAVAPENARGGIAIAIAIMGAAAVPIGIYDRYRRRSTISFAPTLANDPAYQRLRTSFSAMAASKRKWRIISQTKVKDQKRNAGATSTVKRFQVSFRPKSPWFLRSNVLPLMIPANHKLYLFPDAVLAVDRGKLTRIPYDELRVHASTTVFIEPNALVPKDAPVLGTTWQFVNKSGGPDRRMKNNRQLTELRYDVLTVEHPIFGSTTFYLSAPGVAQGFREAAAELRAKLAVPDAEKGNIATVTS